MRFFDASALVKRYVGEDHSGQVRSLLRGKGRRAMSRLSHAELASALSRLCREKAIDERERDRILELIPIDMAGFHVVEVSEEIVRSCVRLVSAHALRASDGIQLASCLYLREQTGTDVTLVAFDERLSKAAIEEKIRVEPAARG